MVVGSIPSIGLRYHSLPFVLFYHFSKGSSIDKEMGLWWLSCHCLRALLCSCHPLLHPCLPLTVSLWANSFICLLLSVLSGWRSKAVQSSFPTPGTYLTLSQSSFLWLWSAFTLWGSLQSWNLPRRSARPGATNSSQLTGKIYSVFRIWPFCLQGSDDQPVLRLFSLRHSIHIYPEVLQAA